MNQAVELIRSWLCAAGVPAQHLPWLSALLLVAAAGAGVWVACGIIGIVWRHVLVPRAKATRTKLDDFLLGKSVKRGVVMLVASILCRGWLPVALAQYATMQKRVTDLCSVTLVIAAVMTVNAVIGAFYRYLQSEDKHQAGAIYNLKQMLQLIFWIVGTVMCVSILFHRTPLYVLSGIGASAAILMLVFQDTILGFVAGIQLNVNDMLRPGDWICAPKFDINGIVEKVGLTTVKVRNYDMSTVTVPPYKLFTESFQNWKTMREMRARRIMRSVCIDADTVRFLDPAELERYAGEPWAAGLDLTHRQVNLTLFRHWLEWTVAQWPTSVSLTDPKQYVFSMVRELPVTPQGVPVEIYMFTSETEWAPFERIQADVTDHVLASVSLFGLRIYQAPTALSVSRRN